MPGASSVADLKKHLGRMRAVEVEGGGGTRWSFRVRAVPLRLWDPRNEWYAKTRFRDPEKWQAKLEDSMREPPVEVLRAVLSSGCVEPRVSANPSPDQVGTDDLMTDEVLAVNLYAEIAALTCETAAPGGGIAVEKKADSPDAAAEAAKEPAAAGGVVRDHGRTADQPQER